MGIHMTRHRAVMWKHPQNRKYTTYRNAARGVPSPDHTTCTKLCEVRPCGYRHADERTNRHTHSHPPGGEVTTSSYINRSDSPHRRLTRIFQWYLPGGAYMCIPLNYMVCWAHTSLPKSMSIGSAVFAQLTRLTNTDTQTTLLQITRTNSPHLVALLEG